MKIFTILLSFMVFNFAYAGGAADTCMKSATTWALKSEAKKTGVKIEKIKVIENRSLGNGANLYLMSLFVEGPKTGDNTHWEIAGEFELETSSCKILVGRRYWAH